MWCAADDHDYKCHIPVCAKGLLDSSFNQADIEKISNFTKLPQISHFLQK